MEKRRHRHHSSENLQAKKTRMALAVFTVIGLMSGLAGYGIHQSDRLALENGCSDISACMTVALQYLSAQFADYQTVNPQQ